MQFSAFTAQCPYEIGDTVKDVSGNVLTITDIASVHYLKKQSVEFMYEFDYSGKYKKIAALPIAKTWKERTFYPFFPALSPPRLHGAPWGLTRLAFRK
jgi:hypothetical protein